MSCPQNALTDKGFATKRCGTMAQKQSAPDQFALTRGDDHTQLRET